jgi:hypothetical protein
MGKKSKASWEDEWKRTMETPGGRWIVVPIGIVMIVLFATALVLGLLWPEPLPKPVFSVPAGLSVLAYYAFQLRKFFQGQDGHRLALMNRSDGVGNQSVSGRGVAPVIKGDNNNVTVIHAAPTEKPSRKKAPSRSKGPVKAGGSVDARDHQP